MRTGSRTKSKQGADAKGKRGGGTPSPERNVDLATAVDVRREMAKVYRDMRSGTVKSAEGCKFVYVLAAIGKLIESELLEKRLDDMEARFAAATQTR